MIKLITCLFFILFSSPLISSSCDFTQAICSSAGITCPSGGSLQVGDTSFDLVSLDLVSFNNLRVVHGDVEGRVAVKNNFVGDNGVSVGDLLLSDDARYGLIVGNDFSVTGEGRVSPLNSRFFVGGSLNVPSYLLDNSDNCTTSGCLSSSFDSVFTFWSQFSALLDAQADNLEVSYINDQAIFNCTSSAPVYFIHIPSDNFNTISSYSTAGCSASASFVITITGSSIVFHGDAFNVSGTVIYNIPSGDVYINSSVIGNIVAPSSSINSRAGTIYGTVIAGDIVNVVQVNMGCPPTNTQPPVSTGSTPTPAPPALCENCDWTEVICSSAGITCPNRSTFDVGSSSYNIPDLDVISFNDATITNGDTEGRTAVRNNFYGRNGISVADLVCDGKGNGLIVGGDLNIEGDARISPLNEEYFVGGTASAPSYLTEDARDCSSIGASSGCLNSQFDKLKSFYTSFSGSLSARQENTVVVTQFSYAIVTCQSDSSNYFLRINSTDLSQITSYCLVGCNVDANYVITTVGDVQLGGQTLKVGGLVVYNVPEGDITLTSSVYGNIVAPNSNINQRAGTVYGSVVAGNLSNIVQINKGTCIPDRVASRQSSDDFCASITGSAAGAPNAGGSNTGSSNSGANTGSNTGSSNSGSGVNTGSNNSGSSVENGSGNGNGQGSNSGANQISISFAFVMLALSLFF